MDTPVIILIGIGIAIIAEIYIHRCRRMSSKERNPQ